MTKKSLSIFCFLFVLLGSANAQDDMMSMLDQEEPPKKEFVTSTFKGTRLINFHTNEVLGRRTLEFKISHRFWNVDTSAYGFFGLDGPASIRLGLEYSHNGRLMFGVGRNSFFKQVDYLVKYKLLRQTTDNSMPVSVSLVGTAHMTTSKGYTGENRWSFTVTAPISRKFSEGISIQVAPVWQHFNLVSTGDASEQFACNFSGRLKLTKRTSIIGEYSLRLTEFESYDYKNTSGIGIEMETGGHIFQVFLTNAYAMAENQNIQANAYGWDKGRFRIGFNISRSFSLAKKTDANKIH